MIVAGAGVEVATLLVNEFRATGRCSKPSLVFAMLSNADTWGDFLFGHARSARSNGFRGVREYIPAADK